MERTSALRLLNGESYSSLASFSRISSRCSTLHDSGLLFRFTSYSPFASSDLRFASSTFLRFQSFTFMLALDSRNKNGRKLARICIRCKGIPEMSVYLSALFSIIFISLTLILRSQDTYVYTYCTVVVSLNFIADHRRKHSATWARYAFEDLELRS